MKSFRSFQEDDENDTHLFAETEQYVLENYPNPDRVGCPGPATLRRFVETPGDVDLSEMNDLHVMHCAECTRDLMELRLERQRRLTGAARVSRFKWRIWAPAAVAAAIAIVLISTFLTTQNRPAALDPAIAEAHDPVPKFIDLSEDGVSRGTEDSKRPPLALSPQLFDLQLRLPYFSSTGTYRVALAKKRDLNSTVVSATASAVVNGAQTDLRLKLDLRDVPIGDYFLATQRLEDNPPSFYPVTVN